MTFAVHTGDVLDVLRTLPPESFDALLSDPPAGISFMGKAWDSDKGGRDHWIAWLASVMREALRVLRPGAHVLVWALPRTSHWTATAIENAGFEVRDVICHLFGSGFPKSSNVSKMIDAANGDEREIVNVGTANCPFIQSGRICEGHDNDVLQKPTIHASTTRAGSAESERWAGQGTALKPSSENWILARKPLDGTIAHNVATHGTGAINVDGCRVAHAGAADLAAHTAGVEAIRAKGGTRGNSWKNSSDLSGASEVSAAGRWPSNLVLTHSVECVRVGSTRVESASHRRGASAHYYPEATRTTYARMTGHAPFGYGDANGRETVDAWQCVEGCPVRELDEQSGERPGMSGGGVHAPDYTGGMFGAIDCASTARADSGGASRFFPQFQWSAEDVDAARFMYTPKASRFERDFGCDDLPLQTAAERVEREPGSAGMDSPRAGAGRTSGARNGHPCVKSVALTKWLATLLLPPERVPAWESEDPKQNARTASTSPAKAICGVEPIEGHGCDLRTCSPGKQPMGPSQPGTSSIIATKTRRTTGSKTSNASRPLNTSEGTPVASSAPESGSSRVESAERSSPSIANTGTSPARDGRSTANANGAIARACPPIGPRRILVPFAGSGSEMVGALRAGWDHVEGIERDEHFVAIASARLERWAEVPAHVEPTESRPARVDEQQVSLFGGFRP